MALAPLTLPLYPLVPLAPGVPQLTRAPADASLPTLLASAIVGVTPPLLQNMLSGAVPSMVNGLGSVSPSTLLSDVTGGAPLLTGDNASTITQAQDSGPQWGIFDKSNNPVVTADSVLSFEYSTDYRISKYPVEEGGFQSYNKVAVSYEAQIAMTQGGQVSDRTAFIQAIEDAKKSLDLYSVATPEYTYLSANIVHADYARKADNGATLITAYIRVEEVRVTATATYSNTQQPTAAGQKSGGQVQPTTPTPAQTQAAAGGAS